ncbi:MAG: hypothetical protein ACOX2A_01705 [Tepidanaerobacteraceae bacterium]
MVVIINGAVTYLGKNQEKPWGRSPRLTIEYKNGKLNKGVKNAKSCKSEK